MSLVEMPSCFKTYDTKPRSSKDIEKCGRVSIPTQKMGGNYLFHTTLQSTPKGWESDFLPSKPEMSTSLQRFGLDEVALLAFRPSRAKLSVITKSNYVLNSPLHCHNFASFWVKDDLKKYKIKAKIQVTSSNYSGMAVFQKNQTGQAMLITDPSPITFTTLSEGKKITCYI